MKASINPDLCVGQGMCVLYAPQVFRLSDDDGRAQTVLADIPDDLAEAVEQAARACPEQAIVIT